MGVMSSRTTGRERHSAPTIGESYIAFLMVTQDPETRQHTDDAEQIEEVRA